MRDKVRIGVWNSYGVWRPPISYVKCLSPLLTHGHVPPRHKNYLLLNLKWLVVESSQLTGSQNFHCTTHCKRYIDVVFWDCLFLSHPSMLVGAMRGPTLEPLKVNAGLDYTLTSVGFARVMLAVAKPMFVAHWPGANWYRG